MSAVSETIVREYFELHGFLTRQDRKYLGRGRESDDGADFLVWNPAPRPRANPPPFVLGSEDLSGIARALVAVRGWHTETFTQGTLENSPLIFRFAEPRAPGTPAAAPQDAPLKLLVVPALPQSEDLREQSIQFLKSKGIDGVIPFRAMLADLVAHVEVNRNYTKSDFLQTLRVLKNYGFVSVPQMALRLEPSRKRKVKGPQTEDLPQASLLADPPPCPIAQTPVETVPPASDSNSLPS